MVGYHVSTNCLPSMRVTHYRDVLRSHSTPSLAALITHTGYRLIGVLTSNLYPAWVQIYQYARVNLLCEAALMMSQGVGKVLTLVTCAYTTLSSGIVSTMSLMLRRLGTPPSRDIYVWGSMCSGMAS